MNTLTYKIGAGIATAAILAATLAPSAFAASITITGNGGHSTNKAKIKNSNVAVVGQSTHTSASTHVDNKAKTGGNTANGNTGGGGVSIDTGLASNTTTVTVTGGSNSATLPDPCGCDSDDVITISDNGHRSHNTARIKNENILVVDQSTGTRAWTHVDNEAKTGHNHADDNTGDGLVSILTGDATNATTVTVEGGSNELLP